ncbi:MAG: hypothetical protein NDI82_08215, partial [Anaeromyxobacteraceae bacterium]|nr:hypothetical protein [Anaeromyxobacteraceae bacterium]
EEPTVAITGSVFAAPVAGATVVARDAAAAAVSATVTTAADGTFTLNVPASRLAAPLFLEASGGTFADEATGAPTAGGALAAHAAGGTLAAGSALHLTPQSTVVARLVQRGKSLAEANASFQAAFGFTPDPAVAPANAAPAGADLAPAQAALRAAAFSELAKDLGVPAAAQFTLLQELARDAADGALDGHDGATQLTVSGVALPIDVQNRFSAAVMARQADTVTNHTGLEVDQIGALPVARRALSAGGAYLVEYLGVDPERVGKVRFRLRVTDAATGAPVTGLALGLMPKMHMSTKSHACPTDPVVEAGGGLYDATIYYVMSTATDTGMSMGVWELGVMAGAERATFYPAVAGGSFPKLTGGTADQIFMPPVAPATTGTRTARTYQVFSEGLALDAGTGTFGVLVTTMDTMMSFPHVTAGATLHAPLDDLTGAAPWVLTSVLVEMSADGATWVTAAEGASGHWVASGIAGLTPGVAATLRVRLTVDSVVKRPATGADDFASFTVTP